MALYKRREKIKLIGEISEAAGKIFAPLGLTPNQWTILALIPALLAAYFISQKEFILGALLFVVAGLIDVIDGAVARATGEVTKKGAYLDTIFDRYVEFIIILPLLFVGLPSYILPANVWLFLYLFGAMMTTYSKAAAKEKEITKEELRGGLLERAERLILLTIGLFAAAISINYLLFVIVVLAVLSNVSALQRISIALTSTGTKRRS